MRALVSIAGHDIPEPSTYSATTATFVDSGRNAEGKVIGAVIREDMAKVEMTWRYIKAADWAAILQLFSSKYGGSFTNQVTFFCQDSNTWETREMYISDRTANAFTHWSEDGIDAYVNPRLALTEV